MVTTRNGTLSEPIDLSPAGLDPRRRLWRELNPRDCIEESPLEARSFAFTSVDCRKPHRSQVADKFTFELNFSMVQDLNKEVGAKCEKRVNAILKIHPVKQDLRIAYQGPPEELLASGERTAICLVVADKGKFKEPTLPS